jgi:hypothetical protein
MTTEIRGDGDRLSRRVFRTSDYCAHWKPPGVFDNRAELFRRGAQSPSIAASLGATRRGTGQGAGEITLMNMPIPRREADCGGFGRNEIRPQLTQFEQEGPVHLGRARI